MGVSEQTYYHWKKQYGGPGVLEIKRLKPLEEDKRRLSRLRQLVADLSLHKIMLQDRDEGPNMRMRGPRRHVSATRRMKRRHANAANQCWSMDFVSDALFDGRRIRTLTVIDNHTRESLAIEVGQGSRASKWLK